MARVWLITTNDNLQAMKFYELRGFRIVAVDRGAVDRARLLKPSIPLVAGSGIELHDELELELIVSPVPASGTERHRPFCERLADSGSVTRFSPWHSAVSQTASVPFTIS